MDVIAVRAANKKISITVVLDFQEGEENKVQNRRQR